jgi:type VI protein secretion system component VasA
MHGIEVADPYVERLIEAFCYLSARTQIKLDAEFRASLSACWKSFIPITFRPRLRSASCASIPASCKAISCAAYACRVTPL